MEKYTNWIEFSEVIGVLSKYLRKENRNKDIIEKYLITTLFYVLCFAKQNNIDMNLSWERWNNKIDYKNYF